jgi:hypothetical protein
MIRGFVLGVISTILQNNSKRIVKLVKFKPKKHSCPKNFPILLSRFLFYFKMIKVFRASPIFHGCGWGRGNNYHLMSQNRGPMGSILK